MGDTAAQAGFGYFTAALVAMACIALSSGVQFAVIGLRRPRDPMHLSYALLCFCIALLALTGAWVDTATTLSQAIDALRLMCIAAAVFFPAFVIFVGRYTGRPVRPATMVAVSVVFAGFLCLNLWRPYTMLFDQLHGAAPEVLPWGEVLFGIDGTTSAWGWAFHLLTYTAFLWAMWMALRQYLRADRLRAALLGSCLLIQFAALLWGDIVVDLMGRPYPYLDAFSFLPFVLLMGSSLASQLQMRTRQLERASQKLRAEAETRQLAELNLRQLAYHDTLTGLPNRLHLTDRLASLLQEAKQEGCYGASLLIDLDNFKTINDSLGHYVGDRMLEVIADRLVATAPLGSTVGRLGGDEFALILGALAPDPDSAAKQAVQIATDMIARLAAPATIKSCVLAVGASIGIAVFPSEQGTAGEVRRHCDIALYRAKASGRNAVRLFEPHMQAEADARLELERGLRTALEQQAMKEQFQLHFQPQLGTDGRLLGAEALLRWQHPLLGEIPPDTLIPIAEETGLIHALGAWVIGEACRHIHDWDRRGVDFGEHLSVNISPWQLAHPQFVEQIEALTTLAGVAPHRLTLELTESALLHDFDIALARLHRLAGIGFRLAMDDFGTGYSSLSYLQRLPLNELKIDRAFISGLRPDISSPLAGFIIDISRRLSITTIAEGVETEQQRVALQGLGCDGVQGYLICPPLDEAEFLQWLAIHASRVSASATS
jgi:diguanylate cyclase (GGDEF)-like protein